jgi:hypothetical protein
MYEELIRLGHEYPVEAEVDDVLDSAHVSTILVPVNQEEGAGALVRLLVIPIQVAASNIPKHLNGYAIERLEQSFHAHELVSRDVKVRVLSPLFTEADMVRNPVMLNQLARPLGRMLLDDEAGALRPEMDSMLPFGSPCTLDEPNYRTRFIVCVCATSAPTCMELNYSATDGVDGWRAGAGKTMSMIFSTWVSVFEPVLYDNALNGAAKLQAQCAVSRMIYGLRCDGLEQALPYMKFKARAICGLRHPDGELIMSLMYKGKHLKVKIVPIPSMHHSMHPEGIARAAEVAFQQACQPT